MARLWDVGGSASFLWSFWQNDQYSTFSAMIPAFFARLYRPHTNKLLTFCMDCFVSQMILFKVLKGLSDAAGCFLRMLKDLFLQTPCREFLCCMVCRKCCTHHCPYILYNGMDGYEPYVVFNSSTEPYIVPCTPVHWSEWQGDPCTPWPHLCLGIEPLFCYIWMHSSMFGMQQHPSIRFFLIRCHILIHLTVSFRDACFSPSWNLPPTTNKRPSSSSVCPFCGLELGKQRMPDCIKCPGDVSRGSVLTYWHFEVPTIDDWEAAARPECSNQDDTQIDNQGRQVISKEER